MDQLHCNICKQEITQLEKDNYLTCYIALNIGDPLLISHKRCGPHYHHNNCKCGLTKKQALGLGCDLED